MSDTLPLIEATVPGVVEGIVSLSPRILQCQQCGAKDDPDSLRVPLSGRSNPALVHVLSGIHFHSRPWTSGHSDNPRLCRECRIGRGCTCIQCADDRRRSKGAPL